MPPSPEGGVQSTENQEGKALHAVRAPSSVAIVLPLDGAAAPAAVAVQNGFLAAWYATPPSERPTVTFHPFAGGAVERAYQGAVESGASFIVGPLGKEELQTLAKRGAFPRPTLALNYLPEGAPAPTQLYQFGLAPTDEAHQSAKQAWLDGRIRAFVVTPKDEWGQRIRQAFRTQWEAIGGTTQYPIDLDEQPEALLTAIAEVRGRATYYKPGEDFIFLAAPSEWAHRLVPVLQQTGMSVYATSHILTGTPQDAELSGIHVLEMPWMASPSPVDARLRAEIAQQWPTHFVTYRRLYALGVDAFRLVGVVQQLESNANARLQGATGSLALDNKRCIVRQGVWAHMEGERLLPLSNTRMP